MKEIETLRRFGKMIRERRKEKGMTQRELSGASGVHVNFIGRIERGIVDVTMGCLRKVLIPLGMEIKVTKKE